MNALQVGIAKVSNDTGMFLAAIYPSNADCFDTEARLSDWNWDHKKITRWVGTYDQPTKVVVRHFTFAEIEMMD